MTHEARQVLEVTPELVNLFGCAIHDAGALRMNTSLAAIAQLHRAHDVECSDREHVRCRKRNASQLCFGISSGNTEARQIECITDYARPHSLSWFLLSKDRDARADFTQT